MRDDYYKKSQKAVLKELDSSESGLDSRDVRKKLELYGKNEIVRKRKISPFKIFLSQFQSFVVYVLIAALVVSALLGEYIDSAVIAAILVLNSVLGFIQEYRAERSIEALKGLTAPKAYVVRDGKQKVVESEELVPGDILLMETGTKLPADCRILEGVNLETQEASLTGESNPVSKKVDLIKKTVGIGDRANMVYSGTIVTRGRGRAIVTGTGMNTEIGRIATMLEVEDTMTPLQKSLKKMGEWLGLATIAISLLIFLGGVFSGKPVLEMFLVAVSLAVAAIPEGLPIVVTVALALGVQRMIKRNALIRKLYSVETLGAASAICTDKTGTLTRNEMTVQKVYVNSKDIKVSGVGYHPEGKYTYQGKLVSDRDIEQLLKIGVLCNDSDITDDSVIGDPTEAALIISAAKIGMKKARLEKEFPRVDEWEFESDRKMMSTLHNVGKEVIQYTKGAPDNVIKHCDRIIENGKIRKLTNNDKKKILAMNEEYASQALRVLGFCYRKGKKIEEKGMIFVGLQAMIDPPRRAAKLAVRKCNEAGIKVIMITGDHKITAEAVGRSVGLTGKAVSGDELEEIDLTKEIDKISIIARANPEHKVKILEALREKGYVVAMTGDGVNDAPALKRADIGVSMGITGTDVAKEASEMILTDDNFASVVNAVEEGRGIYDNIKKFVNYMLSSNVGEVMLIFLAILFGMPLPMVAIQILWLNLVTDGLPAVALGIDPPAKGIMQRKPRDPKEKIMNRDMMLSVGGIGLVIGVVALILFKIHLPMGLVHAQTVAFTALVFFELVRLHIIRSNYKTKILSNKWLIGAVGLSLGLQLLVVYTPLNVLFHTTAIGLMEWVYIVSAGAGLIVFNSILRIIRVRMKWLA